MSELSQLKSTACGVEGETGGEGVKERLLAAAIELFCEKGVHATSVREIVERAGVTKPVLYYYFKNKDGIFRSLISETMTRFSDDLKGACEAGVSDFRERLRLIQAAFLEDAGSNPQLVRFMDAVAFSGQFGEVYDFIGDWKKNQRRITGCFADAQRRGEIRPDADAEFLAQAFVGIVVNAMRVRVYMPEAAGSRGDLVELLMQGIELREQEGAGPGRAAPSQQQ
jgi:AcrR family transcriptional regulator